MIDVVKLYCECLIYPLEEKCKNLRSKVYSNQLSDILFRSIYRKQLEEYEKLLSENYAKLGETLNEEK